MTAGRALSCPGVEPLREATWEDVQVPLPARAQQAQQETGLRALIAQLRFLTVPLTTSSMATALVPTDTGKQDDWPCLHGAPRSHPRPRMEMAQMTRHSDGNSTKE